MYIVSVSKQTNKFVEQLSCRLVSRSLISTFIQTQIKLQFYRTSTLNFPFIHQSIPAVPNPLPPPHLPPQSITQHPYQQSKKQTFKKMIISHSFKIYIFSIIHSVWLMFDQKLIKLVWNNSTFPFSGMSDQNHNSVRSPGVVMGVGTCSQPLGSDKLSNRGRGEGHCWK